MKIVCCRLKVVVNEVQYFIKKTVNSPCPVPCCDIQYVFIGNSKGTEQAFKFFFRNYVCFLQGIFRMNGLLSTKSQGNPEYILHSSLVRHAIIYVCSTFVRVNSNQKSVLHLTENFSGWHCFTTNIAK